MFSMLRKKATVFTLLFTMSLSQMAYASSTGEVISQKDAQTIDCNSCDLSINGEKKVLQDEKLFREMSVDLDKITLEKSIQTCVPLTLSVKVLSEAAKKVKPAAERNAPNSKCLSYKLVKYAYKSNSKTDKYYKYTGAYYPKKNYEGGKIAHTFYEYNAIGL